MLKDAQNARYDAGRPDASAERYRHVIAKIRPSAALPSDIGDCSVLARAHEALAFEYATLDEPAKAVESLYSVAVLSLILDDPGMRGRALAMAADVREAGGEIDEAHKDLTTAALAFEAAGDSGQASRLLARRDGRLEEEVFDFADAPAQPADSPAPAPAPVLAESEAEAEAPAPGAASTADEDGDREPPVNWEEVLRRIEAGEVADAEGDVTSHDVLWMLLETAGDDDGPSDDQLRRAMPLLIDSRPDGDFDAPTLAEDVSLTLYALVKIVDEPTYKAAHGGLADSLEALWSSALNTGNEALESGDLGLAHEAFAFVLESRSLDVPPTSSQQGAAIVGEARVAMAQGDQGVMKDVALASANAVSRLPEVEDRARYGERLAMVLKQMGNATKLRLQLLGRAADSWKQLGDEHSEIRCLLGAALCKASLREYSEAHRDFVELRRRAGELRDVALFSEALLHLGRSWTFAGRPDVAIQCYDSVVERFEKDSLADDRQRVGYARLLLEKSRTLMRMPSALPSADKMARAHALEAREIFAEAGAPNLVKETNEMIRALGR